MANRPTLDDYFMQLAVHVASRSTCQEKQVGSVLVNEHNHILATGYNGGLSGQPECTSKDTCKVYRSNKDNPQQPHKLCPTIHSEANLLAQFRAAHNKPHVPTFSKVYVTTFPCLACLQQLIQAKVDYVYYGSLNTWTSPGQLYKQQIKLIYQPIDPLEVFKHASSPLNYSSRHSDPSLDPKHTLSTEYYQKNYPNKPRKYSPGTIYTPIHQPYRPTNFCKEIDLGSQHNPPNATE